MQENKYKVLISDTLIFALGKFGSKAILFFMVPVFTRYLSTNEYGITELALTISQVIVPVVSVMIFDGIMRFGLEKGTSADDALAIGLVVAILDCVLTLVLVPCMAFYQPMYAWRWYIYWNVILYVFYNVGLNYLKAKGQNRAFALVSLFQTVMIAVINLVLLAGFNMGAKGYLLACNLSYCATTLVVFYVGHVFQGIRNARLDLSLCKRMIAFSAPIALNVLAWDIVSSVDRIMIERIVGEDALGLYSLAVKIPSLINVFLAVFQQSWGISSVRAYEDGDDSSFYSNVFNVFYLGIFCICFILCLIIKPFMALYVGGSFLESWKYVPLLLVAACLNAIAIYYAGLFGAFKQSIVIMTSVLAAGFTNIFVNLLLVWHVGVFGVVVGTLVSYLVMVIIRARSLSKLVHLNIDYRLFAINTTLLVIHSAVCTLEFLSPFSMLITLTVFILINRADLKTVLKKTISALSKA